MINKEFKLILSQQQTTTANRKQDTCFSCKQKGHWASHCPLDSLPPPQQQEESFLEIHGRRYERCLICPNCGNPCLSLISSHNYPARPFYRCSSKLGKDCIRFKWAEEVKSEEMMNVPICSCGAAACRLTTQTIGPNAGLRVFVCPIKKGQGACSFSQPLNAHVMLASSHIEGLSSPSSTLTSCDDTSSAKSNLPDEGDSLNLEIEIETHGSNTRRCLEDGAVPLHVKRGREILVHSEGHEGASGELAPEVDNSVVDSMQDVEELQDLSLEELNQTVQLDVDSIQPASLVSSYSCTYVVSTKSVPKLLKTVANQSLGVQLHDWLGRLAFSPARCLINPAPKPYFCCVFPSFDPVSTPKHVQKVCVEASRVPSGSPLSPDQDAHSSTLALWEPSPNSDPGVEEGNFMMSAISEGFAQLAVHLQNKLLNHLESMDFHDHVSMAQGATFAFDALEQLKIDSRPLRFKVKEYIDRASSLAEIECSIHREQSSHELVVEKYSHEKMQLDDISRAYAMAEADLKASSKHLQALGEQASCLRDMLYLVEAELACCQAENENLESQYDHVYEEKLVLEQRVELSRAAAEEAEKVCQRREEEKNAADEALKKAKILLRE